MLVARAVTIPSVSLASATACHSLVVLRFTIGGLNGELVGSAMHAAVRGFCSAHCRHLYTSCFLASAFISEIDTAAHASSSTLSSAIIFRKSGCVIAGVCSKILRIAISITAGGASSVVVVEAEGELALVAAVALS